MTQGQAKQGVDRPDRTASGLLVSCLAAFSGWMVARNIEITLHELGHAAGGFITGGAVEGISLHPFLRSFAHVSYGHHYESSLLFASAGIAGALLVSFLVSLACRSLRFTLALPLQILAPCALIAEGSYLVDGAISNYGDPSEIASMAYLPVWTVVVIGIGLLLWGGLLLHRRLPLLGIASDAAYLSRLSVLGAILLTGLPGVFFQGFSARVIVSGIIVYAAGCVFTAIVLALISRALARRGVLSSNMPAATFSRLQTSLLIAVALGTSFLMTLVSK